MQLVDRIPRVGIITIRTSLLGVPVANYLDIKMCMLLRTHFPHVVEQVHAHFLHQVRTYAVSVPAPQ